MDSAPTPQPAPLAEETDVSLLAELRTAIEAGRARLDCDFKRLQLGDSPVAVQAEGNIGIYGTTAAVLGSGFLIGWQAGLACLAVGIALNMTVGRRLVYRRIEERVRKTALTDVAVWRKLWRYGGVALTLVATAAPVECRAPDGNWFEFARRLPPLAASPPPGV